MRASRPVIRFVGAVPELSAIEFLIAEIIAEVSSLCKKMSINFGILAVRAAGSQRSSRLAPDGKARGSGRFQPPDFRLELETQSRALIVRQPVRHLRKDGAPVKLSATRTFASTRRSSDRTSSGSAR